MGGGEYFFSPSENESEDQRCKCGWGSETESWAREASGPEVTRNMYANLTRVMQLVAGNKVGDSKQARGQGKRCRISRCLADWRVNMMEGFGLRRRCLTWRLAMRVGVVNEWKAEQMYIR